MDPSKEDDVAAAETCSAGDGGATEEITAAAGAGPLAASNQQVVAAVHAQQQQQQQQQKQRGQGPEVKEEEEEEQEEKSVVDVPKGPALRRALLAFFSQIPPVLGLSLAASAMAHSLLDRFSGDELAGIARQHLPAGELALLVGWRAAVLALCWFAHYDACDLAALQLLSHGPSLYLMSAFYGIRLPTAAASLAIHVILSSLPYLFIRPLSGAHSAAPSLFNREIVTDQFIQGATVLLGGLIYNVIIYTAFKTYLPWTLVLYFNDIPSIEPTDEAAIYSNWATGILSLLFGLAAKSFIFTPCATEPLTETDEQTADFDAAGATLGETVLWNVRGYTRRTRVIFSRTAVVVGVTGIGTYLQCIMAIRGVEAYGAAVYASVWVAAAMVTGLALGFVGGGYEPVAAGSTATAVTTRP